MSNVCSVAMFFLNDSSWKQFCFVSGLVQIRFFSAGRQLEQGREDLRISS